MSEIVKRYAADGLDIIWKPKKCIHSEVCWRTLPHVYKPDEKPWIRPDGASREELISQIDRCPSAALSYSLHERDKDSISDRPTDQDARRVEIEILPDGPIRIEGPADVSVSGKSERIERQIFLCRCGASGNKPYCDGSHKKVGFEG